MNGACNITNIFVGNNNSGRSFYMWSEDYLRFIFEDDFDDMFDGVGAECGGWVAAGVGECFEDDGVGREVAGFEDLGPSVAEESVS